MMDSESDRAQHCGPDSEYHVARRSDGLSLPNDCHIHVGLPLPVAAAGPSWPASSPYDHDSGTTVTTLVVGD